MQPSTWSIRATLAALFSFELLFVLFLFAGKIKASPYFAWIPFDMTGLFFALSGLAGAFIIFMKRVNRHGLVIAAAMAAFVAWLVASQAWTPSVVYAQQKVLSSVLGFGACAGAAVIIAADRARVRRFLTLVFLLALWFAIEGTFAYATAQKRWFVDLSGTSYGGLGSTVGFGAVIVVATLISARRLGALKWGMAALLALFFFVLLVAGHRQSLLALMGVLVLAAVMGFRPVPGGVTFKRFQRAAWRILAAAVVAIVMLIMSGSMTHTLGRIQTLLFVEGGGASASARQAAWAQAIEFWASAPIVGHGIGSFPILQFEAAGQNHYTPCRISGQWTWCTIKDERRHPHNVILEILSELGLVGLILFGVVLLSALRHVTLHRLRDDPLFRCAFLLAVFTFAAAMVAGDVGENRLLFTMLGLLALPALQKKSAAGAGRRAAGLETGWRRAASGGVGLGPPP